MAGCRQVQVAVPASAAPSVEGTLVRCVHYLVIKLQPASTFHSHVVLRCPLIIAILPPAPPPFTPPPDWRPQVFQPATFDLPSAPPLPAEYATNSWGSPAYMASQY